jgi:hypothetical protein
MGPVYLILAGLIGVVVVIYAWALIARVRGRGVARARQSDQDVVARDPARVAARQNLLAWIVTIAVFAVPCWLVWSCANAESAKAQWCAARNADVQLRADEIRALSYAEGNGYGDANVAWSQACSDLYAAPSGGR